MMDAHKIYEACCVTVPRIQKQKVHMGEMERGVGEGKYTHTYIHTYIQTWCNNTCHVTWSVLCKNGPKFGNILIFNFGTANRFARVMSADFVQWFDFM